MTTWKVPQESPRANPERIRRFLDAYGGTEFRHARELLPLMRRDDPDERRVTAHDARLTETLRDTYRIRAKITASAPPSPFYPPGLADDVRDLVVRLDSAKDQPICFWSVDLPSGLCYMVFELLDDGRIAGCVKSAD
jgi:hypothetical protein